MIKTGIATANLHTKVIWSFDCRLLSDDLAARAAKHSVDALRLVYNRDHLDKIATFIDSYQKFVASEEFQPASLMLDLSEGARAMITNLKSEFEVVYGKKVTFTIENGAGDLQITTKSWEGLFKVGAFVFVGYGNAVLKVLEVEASRVVCEVVQGGLVFPDTEIHIPETRIRPTLKDLDQQNIKKILEKGIDYVVLPGISDVREIDEIRTHLCSLSRHEPWLILRVDSKNVYEKLDQLIDHVDGVFISRREMALTVHPAAVAIYTKEIIQMTNDRAKIVMTASEMLGSMRRSPTPTRAEVSDIANAISDGTDALVLSEEVAQGKYGGRAIEVMHRIIDDTESRKDLSLNWVKLTPKIETEMDAVAFGAYTTAERIRAKAIVCITMSGNTALKLASFRTPIPIIAVTFSKDVLRKMALIRGVTGIVLDIDPKIDHVLESVTNLLQSDSWLKPGDKIVFVSVTLSSLGREGSNLFTVQNL